MYVSLSLYNIYIYIYIHREILVICVLCFDCANCDAGVLGFVFVLVCLVYVFVSCIHVTCCYVMLGRSLGGAVLGLAGAVRHHDAPALRRIRRRCCTYHRDVKVRPI